MNINEYGIWHAYKQPTTPMFIYYSKPGLSQPIGYMVPIQQRHRTPNTNKEEVRTVMTQSMLSYSIAMEGSLFLGDKQTCRRCWRPTQALPFPHRKSYTEYLDLETHPSSLWSLNTASYIVLTKLGSRRTMCSLVSHTCLAMSEMLGVILRSTPIRMVLTLSLDLQLIIVLISIHNYALIRNLRWDRDSRESVHPETLGNSRS